MTIVLDWNSIRPLKGSRAEGFEELCAQLARAESPLGSHFERKGTPDAGVECYTVIDDGSEWGWQAKYIDELGEAQWPQLDNSVKTALEKHPRLVRYFICAPLNRPDARIQSRRSAMQRWGDHVEKWTRWAADRDMATEFVWWGSHELLERLSLPQHVGRVNFWFDVRGFDAAWFQARMDEALTTAGPRYTPEIHVDLPIASELEAFGRTEGFFDRIKAHARGIRKKLQTFGYSESKIDAPSLHAAASALTIKVRSILNELGDVKVQPVGSLPFLGIATIVAETVTSADQLSDLLLGFEGEHDAKREQAQESRQRFPKRDSPFRECRLRLHALEFELKETCEALEHAETVAGSTLMLLKGAAGTGKTHLLCDVAKHRSVAGRPTLLLMGQQFVGTEYPWTQIIQQLDLPGLSAEKLVGALEAAAQAAGCRALILIDAINEGSGRLIWPTHMAAFLSHIERSPWIGVLLSVRSSYEEIVVPEEIRARAVSVMHPGFTDHEYDATRTFFVHYGLELPSTPLLTPEFRNPMFLKTLCRGLNATGVRRLPRGFHGITATFDLYLKAINLRLAPLLDFNPKDVLVRRTLDAFATALVDSGERWLTLSKGEEVVNALLPGRDFERSLYRGLVAEGVLSEEVVWRTDTTREEVVFISYERFADHVVAKMLLDAHLDPDSPAVAFSAGGPLAFLWDQSQYVAAGLIEAICIQIPERTGQELVWLAPALLEHRKTGDAFRQSLVWRDTTAFSNGTRKALKALIRNDYDQSETLDVILTVATLPEHPLNARFLDQRLRRDKMPDRDAWWSTYLHNARGKHGAVDRLVDWASSVNPELNLDDDTVDLCAMTLSWMLSTPNRFLRDRATKALVCLLTGRINAVVRLVERFADVDDLYVAERICAVAYGVATRSYDSEKVGILAESVYRQIFAAGTPPVHLLLRDYARGVVERALHLGARIDFAIERIRPPYRSTWPHIPTEEEIQPLMADWSKGAHDSGELEWARNCIASSVMGDDFARYVIGTNSSNTSYEWLSVRLEDPVWQSTEERLAELVSTFSDEASAVWKRLDDADRELKIAFIRFALPARLMEKMLAASQGAKDDNTVNEKLANQVEEIGGSINDELEHNRAHALGALKELLSDDQVERLNELLIAKGNGPHRQPGFDLRIVQRYILWRVFDLGWTTERFGEFDRFSIGYRGRAASKPERIGKKYQWIAYHEILALIADHYQCREPYREGGDRCYDGPWQDSLRDIDPTCTLRASRGGTSWDGHTPSWWSAFRYDDWGDPGNPKGWVMRRDDLPKLEGLLLSTHPRDMSRWLNVNGYFCWQQQPPADQESTDVERRQFWYSVAGYLIKAQDADHFMTWAKGVHFREQRMPEPPKVYQMFLGEHCSSPASRYFGDDGWKQPGPGCPVKIRPMSFEYLSEASGFDCSIDESFSLRLPACDLMAELGLQWTGYDADYVDSEAKLATFDPTASSDGPNALLIREDLLKPFLAREGLSVVWMILGEKLSMGAGLRPAHFASVQLSGAYMLRDGDLVGFLNFKAEPGDEDGTVPEGIKA